MAHKVDPWVCLLFAKVQALGVGRVRVCVCVCVCAVAELYDAHSAFSLENVAWLHAVQFLRFILLRSLVFLQHRVFEEERKRRDLELQIWEEERQARARDLLFQQKEARAMDAEVRSLSMSNPLTASQLIPSRLCRRTACMHFS